MPASCVGCRLSKVRCDLEDQLASSLKSCSRCSRIGMKCEKAPPSRRGQPSLKRTISKMGAPLKALLRTEQIDGNSTPSYSEAAVNQTGFLGARSGGSDSALALQTKLHHGEKWMASTALATGDINAVQRLVRHWALIAKERNSYDLFDFTTALARKCGIPLSNIVSTVEDGHASHADSITRPRFFEELLRTAPGFCTCRVNSAVGTHFFANETFEAVICSAADLNKTWAANAGPSVHDMFFHPEDQPAAMAAMASAAARAFTSPDVPIVQKVETAVRIRERHGGSYITCSMTIRFVSTLEGTWFEGFLQFLPHHQELSIVDFSPSLPRQSPSQLTELPQLEEVGSVQPLELHSLPHSSSCSSSAATSSSTTSQGSSTLATPSSQPVSPLLAPQSLGCEFPHSTAGSSWELKNTMAGMHRGAATAVVCGEAVIAEEEIQQSIGSLQDAQQLLDLIDSDVDLDAFE